MSVEVGCLWLSPKTSDKFSESPTLPLPVSALAQMVENVILSQLVVDAAKIPIKMGMFFRSRVLKVQQFGSLDFSPERIKLTFNRRAEVLVPDVYRFSQSVFREWF